MGKGNGNGNDVETQQIDDESVRVRIRGMRDDGIPCWTLSSLYCQWPECAQVQIHAGHTSVLRTWLVMT